jgi:nitrogen-specific signal transduction histidine kinase
MGIPQGNEPDKKDATKKLIHGAAHDLNNVMMAIAGSAELMLESADDMRLRILADRILQASKTGMALVDSLKTTEGRVPSGSVPGNRRPNP